MKNKTIVKITSLIALVVIAFFGAVSCETPEVDVSDYDWSAVNAQNDPTLNGGVNPNLPFSASIIKKTTGTGASADTITGFEIEVTIPENSDVLRGDVTSLDFISFHTFTKATTALTADTLSSPLSLTLENRRRNIFTVKLTANINTANAYSDLVMRIDGKKFTYDHGLRADIDNNGKIEEGYDDYGYITLTVTGSGVGAKITNFNSPGQKWDTGFSFENFPNISSVTTGSTPTTANVFQFTGNGPATNSNTLLVVDVGYNTGTDTNASAWNAYYKDIGDKLAGGIKLQKLSGDTWGSDKAAEYVGSATDGSQGFIVIKGVTFDNLATYRLIWTGSAYTETTNSYYGVKQRIYIGSASNAERFTRTEVLGNRVTPYNGNLLTYIGASQKFGAKYDKDSYDGEKKNNILRIELTDNNQYGNQFFWNSVSLDTFKKSFQIVYSLSGTPSNFASDLVYVDVKAIEFKDELKPRPVSPDPSGDNVLYITLDPNFKLDSQNIYFRINNDITITDKLTTPKTLTFGIADPLYGNYAFYQASAWNGSFTPPPPNPPQNVSATAVSSEQIDISWDPASGVLYWLIYDDDDNQVGYSYTNFYSATSLNPSTTYYFYVVAYNNNGDPSNPSQTVSATTQTPSAPSSAPANFNVVETGYGLYFSWSSVTDADEYEISDVDENGSETTSDLYYPVYQQLSAGSYSFKVRAVNNTGPGPWSTPKTITILTGSSWKDSSDNIIVFTTYEDFTYTDDQGTSELGTYTVDASGAVTFTGSSGDVLENDSATVNFTTEKLTLTSDSTEFDLQP